MSECWNYDLEDYESEEIYCDYGFEQCVDPLTKSMGNCAFECWLMLKEMELALNFCPNCRDKVKWFQRKIINDFDGQKWHKDCWLDWYEGRVKK